MNVFNINELFVYIGQFIDNYIDLKNYEIAIKGYMMPNDNRREFTLIVKVLFDRRLNGYYTINQHGVLHGRYVIFQEGYDLPNYTVYKGELSKVILSRISHLSQCLHLHKEYYSNFELIVVPGEGRRLIGYNHEYNNDNIYSQGEFMYGRHR